MATKKISQFGAAATLTGAELVEGVQDGDNVKLTTAAIGALGTPASNRLVPVGGTTGQALAKVSDTDFDVSWQDIEGTGGGGGGGAFAGCRAYNDGVQSIAHNTATAVTFNTDEWDTNSIHSTSANTSRLTIPADKAGRWEFHYRVAFAPSGTGVRVAFLKVNGATDAIGSSVVSQANTPVQNSIVGVLQIDLAAGDYVELFVYQDSGGALNIGNSLASDRGIVTFIEAFLIQAAGAGGNITPDTHPASPNAIDLEFESAADLSALTWRNQGGAAVSVANGCLVLIAPTSGSANLRIQEFNAPSGAWKIRAKVAASQTQSNFTRIGFGVLRSSNQKTLSIESSFNTTAKIEVNWWDLTAFGGTINTGFVFPGDQYGWIYFEVEWDGTTNYTFRYSKTGVEGTFITMQVRAAATDLGAAADKIVLYANSENAGSTTLICDWIRRIS